VDYSYWSNTGMPDMVNHEKLYKEKLLKIYSDYNTVVQKVKQGISNTYSPPSSQQYSPPAQQNSECDDIEQQIRDEVTAGGGFATESQIQALTARRMKELKCY
jgi:hypothetical protein